MSSNVAKEYEAFMKLADGRCRDEQEKALIREAYNVASEAHKGVRLHSGKPYIIRPLEVASIVVADIGLGCKSMCAALLFDVVENTDYTIDYKDNIIPGTATAIITGKGNYSGTVSKTFTIVPKTTSISSLSAVSKGFTVKWKKQSTKTTGYQIQIATNSKFTSGVKSYTITKNSTLSKKITKLTAKKKYYVRIRTYKTVNGTKYYSSWSSAKSVTTKK